MQNISALPKRIELHGIGLCGIRPYVFKDNEKSHTFLTWIDWDHGNAISPFSFASSYYVVYIKQDLSVNCVKESIDKIASKQSLDSIVESLMNYLRKARKVEVTIYDRPSWLLYPIAYKQGTDAIIRQLSKARTLLKKVTLMSVILDLARLKAILPNKPSSKSNILVSNLLSEIGIADIQIKRAWLSNKYFYNGIPKQFSSLHSRVADQSGWFLKTHYIAGIIDRGVGHAKMNTIVVAYYYDRTTLERVAHDIGVFVDICKMIETISQVPTVLQIFRVIATYLYTVLKMALENFSGDEIPILQVYTPPFDNDPCWSLQPQDLVFIPFPMLLQAVYTTTTKKLFRESLGQSDDQASKNVNNGRSISSVRSSFNPRQRIVIANQLVANQYTKQLLSVFGSLDECDKDSVIRIRSMSELLFRYLWTPKRWGFVLVEEKLKEYIDMHKKGEIPNLEQLYVDAGRRSVKLKYVADGAKPGPSLFNRTSIATLPLYLDTKIILLQIDSTGWLDINEYGRQNAYRIKLVDLNQYVAPVIGEDIDDPLLHLNITPIRVECT